jgi:DNA-directed RNA polymerase specialized sigma24 family protein
MRLPSDSAAPLLLDDSELVERVAQRDQAAFETLMRRHNSRLFRVARAILRDDVEAEDAMQDAYLDAYRHISDFRGGAQLVTWLTRIVINHALMRLRRRRRDQSIVLFGRHRTTEPGVESGQMEADVADERASRRQESCSGKRLAACSSDASTISPSRFAWSSSCATSKAPGELPYVCLLHPTMKATLRVQ